MGVKWNKQPEIQQKKQKQMKQNIFCYVYYLTGAELFFFVIKCMAYDVWSSTVTWFELRNKTNVYSDVHG